MRIPLLMAIILGVLSLIVDAYIFYDLKRNFPKKRIAWIGYGLLSVVLWLVICVAIASPYRDASKDITCIMWTLFAYITIYFSKSIFVIFSLIGLIPRAFGRKKSLQLGKWVGVPLAVICFVSIWWGAFVTRHQIQINEVTVVSERLPRGFDGFRIAQISDLHVGTWGEDTRFIKRLVDSVNMQNPDIIVFTGDLVNRETSEASPFLAELRRLHAPYGVYSILGNHDYGDYITWHDPAEKVINLELMKAWQRQIGWVLLNNRRVDIVADSDTIRLIGVENWGEPPFHQYGHLTAAYPLSKDSLLNLNDDNFKLLLTHNPEHWRQEVTRISNIDLSLSGHTHAMQMVFGAGNLRWSPASLKYAQWGGLYKYDKATADSSNPMYLYVNIGAGEVGMPFRLGGATPEISIITLRCKDSGAESSKAGLVTKL